MADSECNGGHGGAGAGGSGGGGGAGGPSVGIAWTGTTSMVTLDGTSSHDACLNDIAELLHFRWRRYVRSGGNRWNSRNRWQPGRGRPVGPHRLLERRGGVLDQRSRFSVEGNSTPLTPRLAWQGGGNVNRSACDLFHAPPSLPGEEGGRGEGVPCEEGARLTFADGSSFRPSRAPSRRDAAPARARWSRLARPAWGPAAPIPAAP